MNGGKGFCGRKRSMHCYEVRGNEYMDWVFIENLQDLISWPRLWMHRTTLLSLDTRSISFVFMA